MRFRRSYKTPEVIEKYENQILRARKKKLTSTTITKKEEKIECSQQKCKLKFWYRYKYPMKTSIDTSFPLAFSSTHSHRKLVCVFSSSFCFCSNFFFFSVLFLFCYALHTRLSHYGSAIVFVRMFLSIYIFPRFYFGSTFCVSVFTNKLPLFRISFSISFAFFCSCCTLDPPWGDGGERTKVRYRIFCE